MCKQEIVFKQMTKSKQETIYLGQIELFGVELFYYLTVFIHIRQK